ncbi:hypothetical protein AB834_01645 [PVC group bacterium (ex Bugula neritina AB1)]|nr:hypothetical protein AB834_01645 [PVC group bacterium (ex Bugula neritina AB1)]
MSLTILNVIAGSALKMIAFVVKSQLDAKRQERLATLNSSNRRIEALLKNGDHADNWTKYTRRLLAILIIGTYCFVIIYHVAFHPEIEYTVMVHQSNSWLLNLFANLSEKTSLKISAGSLLWDFQNFIGIIAGFYFTPMGRSK